MGPSLVNLTFNPSRITAHEGTAGKWMFTEAGRTRKAFRDRDIAIVGPAETTDEQLLSRATVQPRQCHSQWLWVPVAVSVSVTCDFLSD